MNEQFTARISHAAHTDRPEIVTELEQMTGNLGHRVLKSLNLSDSVHRDLWNWAFGVAAK
jgi:hypothetical protein